MKKGTRIRHLKTGRTGTIAMVFPNDWIVVLWDIGGESGCPVGEVEVISDKRFDYRGN